MKKLVRKGKKFQGFCIGLDVHKWTISYSIFSREGDEIKYGKIKACKSAFKKLIAEWQAKDAIQVAMEACGSFLWIYDLCVQMLGKERVHVAQPAKLKVIANSQEKNDANDAWWLGYFLYERRLPKAFIPCDTLRELRIATRELRAVTKERSDLLRRISSHLRQLGIRAPKSWYESFPKRLIVKKLIRMEKGIRERALRRLYIRIMHLTREMNTWGRTIRGLVEGFAEIKMMQQEIPGIGERTGPVIYAELGTPTRFYSAKAYGKATGLTPGYRESGGKKSKCLISRSGSAHARWAFSQAIMGCLHCKYGPGAWIKRWILQKSKGKPKKKFVIAAARKLAEGVWRLFAYGEAFDLKKAFPLGKPA